MSEPQKQPEKKPILDKKTILFLIGITVIGLSIYVVLNIYFPDEPEITQQSPPNVMPEIINPIEPNKFNVANFDRCVKLLIDYVKIYGIFDSTQSSTDKIKLNDILSQYNDLNCPLVENQLSQTDQYKNRNNLEQ